MKADQLAIYVHDNLQAERIKHLYGLQDAEWVKDNAVGNASVFGKGGIILAARLEFCYQWGMEFELLTLEGDQHAYTLHPSWKEGEPFVCHIGFHVEEWPENMDGLPIAQDMITYSHTNPFLVENGRRYHYRVYDTISTTGTFSKFIQRIKL